MAPLFIHHMRDTAEHWMLGTANEGRVPAGSHGPKTFTDGDRASQGCRERNPLIFTVKRRQEKKVEAFVEN